MRNVCKCVCKQRIGTRPHTSPHNIPIPGTEITVWVAIFVHGVVSRILHLARRFLCDTPTSKRDAVGRVVDGWATEAQGRRQTRRYYEGSYPQAVSRGGDKKPGSARAAERELGRNQNKK